MGRITPATHLRFLDVVGGGIAAHPQRFVVVHHDVWLSRGVTAGGKGNIRGSAGAAWQRRVPGTKGGLPCPPQAPRPPRRSPRERLSSNPPHSSPSTLPAPRPPGCRHSPSRGPITAAAPPSHLHHPNLPKRGDRDPRCLPRWSALLPSSCPSSPPVPPGGLRPGAGRQQEQPAKVLSGWSGLRAQRGPSPSPGIPGHFNRPARSGSGTGAGCRRSSPPRFRGTDPPRPILAPRPRCPGASADGEGDAGTGTSTALGARRGGAAGDRPPPGPAVNTALPGLPGPALLLEVSVPSVRPSPPPPPSPPPAGSPGLRPADLGQREGRGRQHGKGREGKGTHRTGSAPPRRPPSVAPPVPPLPPRDPLPPHAPSLHVPPIRCPPECRSRALPARPGPPAAGVARPPPSRAAAGPGGGLRWPTSGGCSQPWRRRFVTSRARLSGG